MMMMENCNFASMLFMSGFHFLEFLAVIGLIIFLGVLMFRSSTDRTSNAG
ncbi:MAG: hypothetical protein AAFR39_07955 [Pseudomonadota bacterium]